MLLRRFIPPVARRHPNFFIVVFGLAMFHLAFGLTHLLSPGRFRHSGVDSVYEYISLEVWGVAGLVVWTVLTVGALTDRWTLAKIGVGLGMSFCLLRVYLFEFVSTPDSAITGGAIIWLFIALVHFAVISEPPRR